jgi:hypothetical protein
MSVYSARQVPETLQHAPLTTIPDFFFVPSARPITGQRAFEQTHVVLLVSSSSQADKYPECPVHWCSDAKPIARGESHHYLLGIQA